MITYDDVEIELMTSDGQSPLTKPILLIRTKDYDNQLGYSLDTETGELERMCICAAWYEHECTCGYDWSYDE